MLDDAIRQYGDSWLCAQAPRNHVAISSRSRFARNLARRLFVTQAPREALEETIGRVREAAERVAPLRDFTFLALAGLDASERQFLRECRLISPEMENLPQGRALLLSPDCRVSLMINEEDHLRIQCLGAGMSIHETCAKLIECEEALATELDFAFSPRLGYLTACPTNTGSGLRVSVMLHLPALVCLKRIEELMQNITPYGLTVRGFYGEHSEFQGDFFQLSNEFTLGKTEEEIAELLERVVNYVIEREEQARAELLEKQRLQLEDMFWRAWALLTHSRLMTTQEALFLLSRARLGLEAGLLPRLTHGELNRLTFEIQPAHVESRNGHGSSLAAQERDRLRAVHLRERLAETARE